MRTVCFVRVGIKVTGARWLPNGTAYYSCAGLPKKLSKGMCVWEHSVRILVLTFYRIFLHLWAFYSSKALLNAFSMVCFICILSTFNLSYLGIHLGVSTLSTFLTLFFIISSDISTSTSPATRLFFFFQTEKLFVSSIWAFLLVRLWYIPVTTALTFFTIYTFTLVRKLLMFIAPFLIRVIRPCACSRLFIFFSPGSSL